MPTTAARCKSRSSIAAARVASPNAEAPVRDADVGAQDRARLQIPLIDHLEQRRRAILRQWQIAELINDQKPGTCEEAHAGLPAALKGGLVALGRQLGRGGEVDPVAGIDRGPAERDGQHGLAHPGRPDEQHVRRGVQEPQRGQVSDQLLVDPGLGREVEVRQRPGLGQAGEPLPGRQAPGLGGLDLDLQQPLQRGGQRQVLTAGLVQYPRKGLERIVQLQLGQVGPQLRRAACLTHVGR